MQVAPAEIEDVLIKHPQVKDAGVIGIPDEVAGELPKAFVVKQQRSKISEKQLQQYISGNTHLSSLTLHRRSKIFINREIHFR